MKILTAQSEPSRNMLVSLRSHSLRLQSQTTGCFTSSYRNCVRLQGPDVTSLLGKLLAADPGVRPKSAKEVKVFFACASLHLFLTNLFRQVLESPFFKGADHDPGTHLLICIHIKTVLQCTGGDVLCEGHFFPKCSNF